MRVFLFCFLISQAVFATNTCDQRSSWWKNGWATTLYSGPLTSQTSSKIIKKADFGDSGIIALAIAKKFNSFFENNLDLELETQAVQHFGQQKHFEFNPITLVVHWKDFPWNDKVRTTIAIGDGISIATRKPKLEVKRRGPKNTAHTLNYVMAQVTLSLPSHPQWAFVVRYHHRSGMFGAFHGVHDASTVFAAGIKRWF